MNNTDSELDPETSKARHVKVLYILGWGRSGSTILDNILNQVDGFFSVGELHYLWSRGLLENRLCGCGESVGDCPVWSKVLAQVRSTTGRALDPRELLDMQRDVVRNRQTHRLMLTPGRWIEGRPVAREYARIISALYDAVRDVTGARVIVDSTKRVPDAYLLQSLTNVDAYFVHLVRDPRATAYSWKRLRGLPETHNDKSMRQFSTGASSIRWVLWSGAGELLARRQPAGRSLLVRYEDFIASPQETVRRIVGLTGEPPSEIPFESDRVVRLGTNHTVSGNPSRFKTGAVELRRDDEWLQNQARNDALISTLIAMPLLRHYGYPLRPGPPRDLSKEQT